MLVPVVHALATQYPDIRVTVVSRPFARPFFEGLAPNVNFMGADIKKDYKGIKGLNSLFRRLAAKRPTHIADMHGVLRTYYLRLRFILARYKVANINKHRKEKHQLTSPDKKKLRQLSTSFSNYADVLAQLGFPVTPSFVSIYGDMKRGNLRLLPETIGEKKSFQKWIGIAPFATHEGKIYPLEKMEQVMRQLIERHPNCRLFLFHGPGEEAEKVDGIIERMQQTVPAVRTKPDMVVSASSLLGGIDKELILMSHLNVLVSMDSFNMHLASLVACPVVSVWGATHRFAGFLGWNQKEENCVELPLKCRPCSVYGATPCIHGDYRCLTGIDPSAIVDMVERNIK